MKWMGRIFQNPWDQEKTLDKIKRNCAQSYTIFQGGTLSQEVRHCQRRGSSNSFDTVSLYHTVSLYAGKPYLTVTYESVLILTILHHIVCMGTTVFLARVVGCPEVSHDMRIWNTDIVHGAGRENDREYSAGYIFSWTHGQMHINSPALFVKYTFNLTLIKQPPPPPPKKKKI